MSDHEQSWLTAGMVRSTLEPLLDHYRQLAHAQGSVSEPTDRETKAHYVGQAQGVSDAIAALEEVLGVVPARGPDRPELADEPPKMWPLVNATRGTSPVSPAARNAKVWRPAPGTHRVAP